MFTSMLRIKNAILSLFLSLVLLAVIAQPVYASNGNAYAYGKSKHSATAARPDASATAASSSVQTHTSTQSQKPATTPGDNGDIKTHNLNTPVNDQRDEPKVCGFYLDAFNFDARQNVTWKIVKHTHGETVLSGTIVLASGNGRTADLSLPNGMYKVYWNFEGEHGSAKHKVFKVDCEVKPPTTPVSQHKKPVVSVKSNTCVVNGQMSGSLTVSITNPNSKTATYTVHVGKVSKTVTVNAGKTASVTFTDLKQGDYTVVVKDGKCNDVKVIVKIDECPVVPTEPVGRGGGVVLSDVHTPGATVLANTGDMPLVSSLAALILTVAAALVFIGRPAGKHNAIDTISL